MNTNEIYCLLLDCIKQGKAFEVFNPLDRFEIKNPINNIWVSSPSAEFVRDLIISDLEEIYKKEQPINIDNFCKLKESVSEYQNRMYNHFFNGKKLVSKIEDTLHQKSTPIFQILYGFDYLLKLSDEIEALKAVQHIQSLWTLYISNPEDTINTYKSAKAKHSAQSRNADFRKHFKEKQREEFQRNPNLKANAFAWSFYNNPSMKIPYVPQNQINRLIKLAQENNREFKKSKLAITA